MNLKKLLFVPIMLFGILLQAQTSGGPDAYGYTWKNIDHGTAPPTFNWIDITGIGTQVTGLADDNFVGPFTASNGFQFYWYGTPQFYVGSNGFVSFVGDNIASPFPASIPLTAGSNDFLAVMLSDLNFSGTGNPATCYYWSNADTLIVSFIEVPYWIVSGNNQTGTNTFQIIMDKNNYSITYNYLETDMGANTGLDNIIGIENSTGTLGLAAMIDNEPRDSFAIKFYYPPSTTYQAIDGGMNWNYNPQNGGVFVKANAKKTPLTANVKNYGNTNLTSFNVRDTIYDASGSVISNGTASVPSLNAGNDVTVTFNDSLSLSSEGIYKFRTRVAGISGDLVATNNEIEQEIIAVDTTKGNVWLEYSDQTPDGTGLGWNGGDGGIAIYIEPPFYPARINYARFYMDANATPPVGFHCVIYDDNGPNGSHGTTLDSIFISGNNVSLNQYENVQINNEVVITSGGFYLLWRMDGAGINLARDLTRPISRRTYEILGPGWSGYRRMLTEDFLMGVRVAYAYPKADFGTTNGMDPTINFFDMSLRDPTDWYWEFGDGDTSTQQNPVHTYEWNGVYDVCLTVSNQYGSDSICKKVRVDSIPAIPYFVYDASNLPEVVFTDSSSGPPTAWMWDFDDGQNDQSTAQHPTYTFKNTGHHNVCLRVSNANGISQPYCDSISFAVGINDLDPVEVKVYPNPMKEFTTIELPDKWNGNELKVDLYSITGKKMSFDLVAHQNKLEIGRKNLPSGAYIIRLSWNGVDKARIPLQIE